MCHPSGAVPSLGGGGASAVPAAGGGGGASAIPAVDMETSNDGLRMLSLVLDTESGPTAAITPMAPPDAPVAAATADGTRPLVIFDYDDTLCPSSWIEHHKLRHPNAPYPPNGRADLEVIEAAAHRCLSAAMALGADVLVITNAESGWIENSAARFLPRLLPLLQQLKVVSARSSYEHFFPSVPLCWKAAAFAHEANELWERDDAAMPAAPATVPEGNGKSPTALPIPPAAPAVVKRQRVILSLGDSNEERTAVKIAAEQLGAISKSVKFVQHSPPVELSRQLDTVTSSMQWMLADTKPLDLMLQPP